MFNAENGFFYLLFADQTDFYFTKSLLKTDFDTQLLIRLFEENYRYLCFIGKSSFNPHQEYSMRLYGALTRELLDEPPKKRRFRPFHSRSKQNNTEKDFQKTESIELDFQDLQTRLHSVLELMQKKNDFVLVCPIPIFAELCENNNIRDAFAATSRKRHHSHNITILTGTFDAAFNDSYFGQTALKPGVFFDERLFPEIHQKFSNEDVFPRMIPTYDMLKEALAERMPLLNELSFDNLDSVMRYAVMRISHPELCYQPALYAAVVWAWYENDRFRRQYPRLLLPREAFPSMKSLYSAITSNDFLQTANEVIAAENKTEKQMLTSWKRGKHSFPMCYANKEQNRCQPILEQIAVFRSRIAGHEELLDDSQWHSIAVMERYFQIPFYRASYNMGTMPHELFLSSRYTDFLSELYASLGNDVWNSWNDCSMCLLYQLFKLCYDCSVSTKSDDSDVFNERRRLQYQTCAASIEYCVRQAYTVPHQHQEPSVFYADALIALTTMSPVDIRKYNRRYNFSVE